jgi:hypothetical protein
MYKKRRIKNYLILKIEGLSENIKIAKSIYVIYKNAMKLNFC